MTVIAGVTVDETQTAAHYTPNGQCQAVFGEPRTILEYTIHWWGDPAPDFDGVVANFCNGSLQTSAHFVAEDGRYACLVSPEDVAWACGNAHGNATTVSIECNPRASDGDYRAVAELVKWLRSKYGDGPLVPHKHWVATDCPGVWDLTRLEALTRLDLNVSITTATPTQEDTVTPDDITAIANAILDMPIPRQGPNAANYTGDTSLRSVIANFDQSRDDTITSLRSTPTAPTQLVYKLEQ